MYSVINKLQFLKGIRGRLTIVYSILYGIFISLFVYYITNDSINYFREDFDKALLNYALDISNNIIIDESNSNPIVVLPKTDLAKKLPFSPSSISFSVRTLEGSIVYKSKNFELDIPYYPELATKPEYTHKIRDIKFKKTPYRAINVKIFTENGTPYIIQVATPSTILIEQSQRTIFYRFIAIPLQVLVAAILSYLIAGLALRPVRKLTHAANNIAAENLSQRVPEMHTGDEIEELSKTLNNLLNRLEVSFKAQENFVANASHQLNTPLSIIKGELQLLTAKEGSSNEILQFHHSLKDEIDRLISLVKNMLLISRVEAGSEQFRLNLVRIDEVLLNTASRLNTKAKDKKINIRFDIEDHGNDNFLIKGNKELLDSLFENLLDNAIKYSYEGGLVKILILKSDERIIITIQDHGPGVPQEIVREIFNSRFNRGSFSHVPGTGIGLSISKQITQIHGGQISYRAGAQVGAIFEVVFPVTLENL